MATTKAWLVAKLPSRDEFWGVGSDRTAHHARYAHSDERDLKDLLHEFFRSRYLIGTIVLATTLISVVVALTQPTIYRSEALLVSTTSIAQPQGPTSALSGLAAIAGLSASGGGSKTTLWLAQIQSREFIKEFIEKYNLMPQLYAELWDSRNERWNVPPSEQPDIYDGVDLFKSDILTVQQDAATGLITLSIEWTDGYLTERWAEDLVRLFNETASATDREEAEARYSFLKSEAASTFVVGLRQSISDMMQEQLQTIMLTNVQRMYAFRVVDPPIRPEDAIWPQKKLIVLIGLVVGLFTGTLVVLFRSLPAWAPKEIEDVNRGIGNE